MTKHFATSCAGVYVRVCVIDRYPKLLLLLLPRAGPTLCVCGLPPRTSSGRSVTRIIK